MRTDRRVRRCGVTLLAGAFLGAGLSLPATMTLAQPAAQAVAPVPYASAEVIALAETVADHQLTMLTGNPVDYPFGKDAWYPTGWIQGALFVGLRDLADHTDNPKYKAAIFARGTANQWQVGKRVYHADDQVIGQAYIWASTHGGGDASIAPLRSRLDRILAEPPVTVGLQYGERGDTSIPDCKRRWCWADALFMAPPVWFELSKVTGDPKYADYARKEFAATTDYLFDKDEHLYYRDSRFFERRGPNGEKVFWSRGNGWVYAGLARSIPMLPEGDPARKEMEALFRDMSARLIQVQKSDGNWSPSLLADPATTRPETSGTAFFTYGLAWGIRQGFLDRQTYEPAVRKGWAALTRAVHPDGKLGYVQPVGDRPDTVTYDNTHFYGGGAFLMAAVAVADLDLSDGPDLTVQAEVPHPQMVLNIRTGGTGKDKTYEQRTHYEVPANHRIGDGSIAFEGLGWESDLMAYRLYLDERMAIDIFGKKTPANVLQTVGIGGDTYHKMAPWGMDVLKVGETVGIGGIGRLRDGKAVQLGKSTLNVTLAEPQAQVATAEIRNAGLDDGRTNLVTTLSIHSGSALTHVRARAETSVPEPFVTGLIRHPGVEVIQGEADATGWAFVATWGRQSLAKDDMGMAVFYRVADVEGAPADDGNSLYVTFRDPTRIDYAFGVAWAQDQQGITTSTEFRSWLSKRRLELAAQ